MIRRYRDPITDLVNHRYPWAKSLCASVGIGSSDAFDPSAVERERMLRPVVAYEAELRAKAPAEIQALLKQVEANAIEGTLRQRMLDPSD